METVDFIDQIRGVVDIAAMILSKLDCLSLMNAELVSKTWNKTIAEGRVWYKLLEQEMVSKPSWKHVYERVTAEPAEVSLEDKNGKNVYYRVKQAAETLETNWRKGTFTFRGARIKNENSKNSKEFLVFDSQSIYIGFKNSGAIKVLNRKTLELEKEFPNHGDGLAFMQLDKDHLITASQMDGTIKLFNKHSRELLETVIIKKRKKAVITEFRAKNDLIVLITHTPAEDPWQNGMSCMQIWKINSESKLENVHTEAFPTGSIHHLGLDENYVVLLFLLAGRKNLFDLNISPEVEFRSTKNFEPCFTIAHGVENIYEFKYANGLLAIGSEKCLSVWDVKKRTPRNIKDEAITEANGVSVYGFNSKFIVGHVFSGPVLIWDLDTAMKNPKAASKSLLCSEFQMRFDSDVAIDESSILNLRRPHIVFLDDDRTNYDTGDHLEVVIRDFLPPYKGEESFYEKCCEPCCLSDADDYEL